MFSQSDAVCTTQNLIENISIFLNILLFEVFFLNLTGENLFLNHEIFQVFSAEVCQNHYRWIWIFRKLHSNPCTLLIGLCAACFVAATINPIINFAVALTDSHTIPLGQCMWLQLAPAFSGYFQYILLNVIALERTTCVVFPIW